MGGNSLIQYLNCRDVSDSQIFEAFSKGFSDYFIKLELTEKIFVERFFGPEGNSRDYSFVAVENGTAVGVILGAVKHYEGNKTMRCGTLAIDPKYRGTGIAMKLFEFHKETAISQGCRQLFLEVLVENERAIKFYRNKGYEKVYDLSYFSLATPQAFWGSQVPGYEIKPVGLSELRHSFHQAANVHINWQNDMNYIEKSSNLCCFGGYRGSDHVASICVNPQGKIHFLWVVPECRGQGVGRALLGEAQAEMNLSQLSTGFPNNHHLEGFFKRMGFSRNSVAQFEMYQLL